ncbi:COG3173 Predicted aminoglycoside phosphotransferase [Burkholderiales bacterium]
MPVETSVREGLTRWLMTLQPLRQDLQVLDVRRPQTGFSSDTLLVDVGWISDQKPVKESMVLRLMPTEQPTVFPSYSLTHQVRVTQALHQRGLKVPTVLGYSESSEWIGAPFYVMEQLPGRTAVENPPYHAEGWIHALPREEQGKVWFGLMDVILALGRMDVNDGGFDFLKPTGTSRSPLQHSLEQTRTFLRWVENQQRPLPQLHAVLDWLEHHQPSDEETVICWGDAKLGNLLFEGSTVTGALDWEGAHLGAPCSDLAWALMLDRALSEGIGLSRIAGFPSREETLIYWRDRSGRDTHDLAYYEVFSALKFAVIMASIARIFRHKGWIPETSTMDSENAATSMLKIYAREMGLTF